MTKGYQIIEPVELHRIMSSPDSWELAVMIFRWILCRLQGAYRNELVDVELDVICVRYMGKYPAIGVHYKKMSSPDIAPFIKACISRLLLELPAKDFVEFVDQSKVSWRELTNEIMSSA